MIVMLLASVSGTGTGQRRRLCCPTHRNYDSHECTCRKGPWTGVPYYIQHMTLAISCRSQIDISCSLRALGVEAHRGPVDVVVEDGGPSTAGCICRRLCAQALKSDCHLWPLPARAAARMGVSLQAVCSQPGLEQSLLSLGASCVCYSMATPHASQRMCICFWRLQEP